ncbi:MAG: asparagine synthase (glutamine-hydrolyzing), partial [Spirochaetia bacterium]
GAVNAGPRIVDESHIQAMVAIQRHRGPEAGRVVSDGTVLLGQARLAIVDLAGGAQPMASHDGRYRTVFNGELFNYPELRAELRAAGHRFRTESDTEVILESYRTWGTDCFGRFNGQWALALWDRREGRLVLSRDRVGIAPLYYTRIRDSFVFASEVKALFCHPDVPRRFDPSGISQTFTLWSPVAPRTVFASIEQLPPGSFMVLETGERTAAGRDAGGTSGRTAVGQRSRAAAAGRDAGAGAGGPEAGTAGAAQHYWTMQFGTDGVVRHGSLEENAKRLRETLVEAARLRFSRSDVPVGAYLSGGIDSTVTAAVLSQYTSAPLQTFSVGFADAEFDESRYQDLVARRLGTEHHRIVVDPADIGELFPEVVWHTEQPILRTAPAPLYMLSGAVREAGLKVVVTGEGSDEMLAGYDVFREAAVRRIIAEHPASSVSSGTEVRSPGSPGTEAMLRGLYPWMARSPAVTPAFARSFFSQGGDLSDPAFSHRPRWRSSAALLRLLRPQFSAPSGDEVARSLLSDLPTAFAQWHPLEQAQYLEAHTLLPGYILGPQGDRMLLGHSVEGRFPFLDHTFMELAASLPPEQKLHGLQEKHILKVAFSDMIPDEVASRPKQPYRAPDAASFFAGGDSPDWLESVLNRQAVCDAGVFEPDMVERLLAKCRAHEGIGMSNTDNMRIVAVVSVMLLYQQFIAATAPFARAMAEGREIPVTRLDRKPSHAAT